MVTWCKVKYSNFQIESSSSIISGTYVYYVYNQFLIDRDSYSDIVGYFYDVAPGWIYKNWQGKLAQLPIYPLG